MVDLKFAAAWRDGGFAVRRAPLPTVLRELEIQFGTAVRLGVPVAQTETMTLHYGRAVRLEDILRDIAVIQGLRYQQMNDGYALVP
jgi:ferric-dicitrate binding protein FerR (iron transport regulator)